MNPTRPLPETPDVTAPDGSDVRLLCTGDRGGMAHFTLAPGRVSRAIRHRSVEELWFILGGAGEMWRRFPDGAEEVTALGAGLSLSLPVGVHFQFRSSGPGDLTIVGVTMPPWPGPDEAVFVEGRWPA